MPTPLVRQPLVEGDLGQPPELAGRLARIGECVALVTGAFRLLKNLRSCTSDGFEFVNDVPDAYHLGSADVVSFADGRFEGGDGGGHAVGHVSVAADLMPVSVDGDGLTRAQRVNESLVTHVRAL